MITLTKEQAQQVLNAVDCGAVFNSDGMIRREKALSTRRQALSPTADEALLREVGEAYELLREWVKAVPPNTPLPAMPGVDGDWLDSVSQKLRKRLGAI